MKPMALPEPGQLVVVRERPFVVVDIKASALPSPTTAHDELVKHHLISLSSVEDEGLGEELSVIWELEPGALCLERSKLPALTAFDDPRKFDAFLDAVSWG